MGLAASNARFLGLTARKSDLEYRGQQINQERLKISQQTQQLFERLLTIELPNATLVETDGDAYQAEVNSYNEEVARVNAELEVYQTMDKRLEVNLKNVDTQQQAVMTEIEAVQKVIDKNIDQTFKTFA